MIYLFIFLCSTEGIETGKTGRKPVVKKEDQESKSS